MLSGTAVCLKLPRMGFSQMQRNASMERSSGDGTADIQNAASPTAFPAAYKPFPFFLSNNFLSLVVSVSHTLNVKKYKKNRYIALLKQSVQDLGSS